MNKKQHSTSKQPRLVYWSSIIILLLGTVLRLAAFDEALIEGDQSAILSVAIQAAAFRYLPQVGMKSSVGVMQTGIVPILAAIPMLLVKKAIAVKWFFSILDVLALAWLWCAVRRSIGNRAALITALLYATNPWLIEFIRTIWYQTLVPTFATVAFASYLLLLTPQRRKRPWVLCLALISTTLMGMAHLAALPWALLLFLLGFGLAWREKLWSGFAAGLAGSVIITLPYFMYLVQTSFADIVAMLQAGKQATTWNTAGYHLSQELISGAMVLANTHGDLWERSVLDLQQVYVLPVILLIALIWGTLQVFKKSKHGPSRMLPLFAVGWTLAVPALFLQSGVHLQHFYLLHIFPAPLVLVGAWVERCFASSESRAWHARLWRALVTMLGYVASIALILLALWWSSLWISRINLESQGLLERPTRAWLMDRAAETIADYLTTAPPEAQVIILAQSQGIHSAFDWIRAYANSDAVRVVPANSGVIVPNAPTCYLLGPGVPLSALTLIADDVALNPEMSVPADPPWEFHCASKQPKFPAPLASWTNGMELLQTSFEGTLVVSGQLRITYVWHYDKVTPQEYHIFNHLLYNASPEDTRLVAQVDGSGVPTHYWRDEDILITHFTLQFPETLPSGDYYLMTGAYSWPGLERVALTDGEAAYTVRHWHVP